MENICKNIRSLVLVSFFFIFVLGCSGWAEGTKKSLLGELRKYEKLNSVKPTEEALPKKAMVNSENERGFFVDSLSTIGFFVSAQMGIGLTGEYEWKEKV